MCVTENPIRNRIALFAAAWLCALLAPGCGTTKWSDSSRTGTEQLLISNAIDNAVGKIDFRPVGNKKVWLRWEANGDYPDKKYLALSMRQQMAAHGAILCDTEEEADYIVELRVGAIGTDRDEMLLVGIPAVSVPYISGTSFTSAAIPEIPIVKRTKQRGVAKLAIFAYNKHTGKPIWASGNSQYESSARNLWIAGSGPLTKGTIYDETTFAGHPVPKFMQSKTERRQNSFADHAAVFRENPQEAMLAASANQKVEEYKAPENIVASEPVSSPVNPPQATPSAPVPAYSGAWPQIPLPPSNADSSGDATPLR